MLLNISGIPVEVCKKDIKNMHLYVKPPDGTVTVSAPLTMSNDVIERFVRTKVGWIKKQIAKFDNQPRQSERKYVSGETLFVWGKRYYLWTEYGSRNSLVLSGDKAVLTVRKESTAVQRESFVREWYRELLKAKITRLLPKWEKITGLKAAGWQTKYMTTRWGTCNTKTAKIWINLQLAKKTPECLEYVILHELIHLVERTHNERFVSLMDTYMPMWREVKATLNDQTLDYIEQGNPRGLRMLGITPEGKQKEVMALPAKGHIVVLGAAGSGKTTMALLRAHHLANIPNGGRVLLVTFNGALVEHMRGISDSRPAKLVVENYHKFARGYLNSRGKMPSQNGILGPDEKLCYIEQAVDALKRLYPHESTFRRSKEFFADEITFIEKFGFKNLASYNDAERIGRAAASIKRENRKWVFAVYEKYIKLREETGHKYDWDDLAFYVHSELQEDDSERRYTHIIVDEGQDFSPMMIKSLVDAVADGGSFTFFGDVAQQIYGSRLSWRDSGINTDKIWRFDVNYRNPAAITAFAKDITESEYWQPDGDMVDATAQIAEGPKPILVKFSSKQREMSWVVEKAILTGRTSSTVIVCRNRADIDSFMLALKNKGCYATEIKKDTPSYAHIKTVYLTTFHSAKGLEFDNVFVPFLTDDKLPDPETVANSVSKKVAYSDEIKLLYVAATRPKFGLYMSYSGTLSPLFPEDADSYDFYDEEDAV